LEEVQEFVPALFEPLHERDNAKAREGDRALDGLVGPSAEEMMRVPQRAQVTLELTLLIPGIIGVELAYEDDDNSVIKVV
jgi:hypothetical protein